MPLNYKPDCEKRHNAGINLPRAQHSSRAEKMTMTEMLSQARVEGVVRLRVLIHHDRSAFVQCRTCHSIGVINLTSYVDNE